MARILTVVAALAIVVLAGVVLALAPEEETSQAPFETAVSQGQQGVGRNIRVTFTGVRAATTATTDFGDWTGTTPGAWIAVDLTADTVIDRSGLSAWLLVDGLTFEASTRADGYSLEGWIVDAGLPQTGTMLFEVPRELLGPGHDARVLVAANGDWRLDSAISTRVDLDALALDDELVFSSPERVSP